MRAMMLGLCAMVLLSGCADKMTMYDLGSMWKQEHFIPPTFFKPGSVEYIKCNKGATHKSDKWKMDLCGSLVDDNAKLAFDASQMSTASYKDLVIPAAIHGAFFMGGMAILGTQINSGLQNQPQAQGALAGSSISTLNVRGTGPAFAGMRPAPLGGLR